MSRYALIDFRHPEKGLANRDQTGTFGSNMKAGGLIGRVIGKIKSSSTVVPNLTLAYLKAIATQEGKKAVIYSGMPQGEEWILIASSLHHYKLEIALAQEIKKAFPQSKVGFINAFATTNPELFEEVADFVILGEPEWALWKHFRGEQDLVGRVVSEPQLDLDQLPFPQWEKDRLWEYGYFPALSRRPFLTIQSSRGCPYGCHFCPYLVLQGLPLRRRSNQLVLAELKHLKTEYGVKSVLFRDIMFSYDMKGTKELVQMIAQANLGIEFGCETRPDHFDDELIELLKAAQFKMVNLGIESPHRDILKASGRKSVKNNRIEKVIKKLERAGIKVQAFYILGLQEDTKQSMEDTIAYSRKLNTFTAQFCILTPFPGTKYYEDLDKSLLLTDDFGRFTEYEPVVDIAGATPGDILELRDLAFSGYYMRPQWFTKHGVRLGLELLVNIFKH